MNDLNDLFYFRYNVSFVLDSGLIFLYILPDLSYVSQEPSNFTTLSTEAKVRLSHREDRRGRLCRAHCSAPIRKPKLRIDGVWYTVLSHI